MRFARVAAALAVATAVALGWLWMRPGIDGLVGRPAIPDAPRTPLVAEASPPVNEQAGSPTPAAGETDAPGVAREAPATFPDPSGDLALYADHPMSDVPHRVVRGWGLGPRSPRPGHVGALVVVDPKISLAALRNLVRDIRAYHRSADALAIRVLDSMHAATYNRHADGGALLAESVVATIHVNEQLGLDDTKVHGEEISAESEAEAGEGDAEVAGDFVASAEGEGAPGGATGEEATGVSEGGEADDGDATPAPDGAESGLTAEEESPPQGEAPVGDALEEGSGVATTDPV